MKNIEYNLNHVSILKIIITVFFFINFYHRGMADEGTLHNSRVVARVADERPSWYAVVSVNGKKKLYVKGDIFCSETNITDCLRIQDIDPALLILEDVNSNKTYLIQPGQRIPLQGTEIIFEETIKSNVIEYRYNPPGVSDRSEVYEFIVANLEPDRIVLEKTHSLTPAELPGDKKTIFSDIQVDNEQEKRITADFFEDIEINRIGRQMWAVKTRDPRLTYSRIKNILIGMMRKVKPGYRFGEGPSLRFTSEVGDAVIDKNGFLIQNLAVAKLAEHSGIREGDLIKSINGYPVTSLYGLYKIYTSIKAGSGVKIVNVDIVRDGEEKRLTYKIK